MTVRDYLRTHWRPGQYVCEVNEDGALASLGDSFHGLAAGRGRAKLRSGVGCRRRYGLPESLALCPDHLDLLVTARQEPL